MFSKTGKKKNPNLTTFNSFVSVYPQESREGYIT